MKLILKIIWNIFKYLLYKVKKKSICYLCGLIVWKLSSYILYKHFGIYRDFFSKIMVATATILLHWAVSRKCAGVLEKLSLSNTCFPPQQMTQALEKSKIHLLSQYSCSFNTTRGYAHYNYFIHLFLGEIYCYSGNLI